MLIYLYFLLTNVVFPQIISYAQALVEPTVILLISIVGIIIMLGAVGMRISNNLGSTIMNAVFQAIGFLIQTLFNAIAWIVRSIFQLIPIVFNGSRNTFTQRGMTALWSNVLAVVITAIIIIIII